MFGNQSEIDEFLEQREIFQTLNSIRMDKTFYLTESVSQSDQIVIDYDHSMCHKLKFKVNSEGITVCKVISMPNKVLITCGQSYIVRLWSLLGKSLCVVNLEYPLPYRWDIMINRFERRKEKYIKAVKIRRKLRQKWYKDITKSKPDASKLGIAISPTNMMEKPEEVETFKSLISD